MDTIAYSYDENGRLARKTFPDGMETSYAYDAQSRFAELTHRNTTYDLTYTWNDVMNPNNIYDSDVAKANAALSIPGADPKDYEFHLSWHDKTVIKKNTNILSWNSGWLRNYHSDWQERLSDDEKYMLDQINKEQIDFGALSWPDQLQQIYGIYSSYYDCEVLE